MISLPMALVVAIAAASTTTAAQAQMPRHDDSAAVSRPQCWQPSCALEIRRGLFFNVIARGNDSVTHRIGLTGRSVVTAVSGVHDATEEARAGRARMIRSNWLGGVALALASASLVAIANSDGDLSLLPPLAASSTALGLSWLSQRDRRMAASHFDRAVWLHNRNLRR